MLHGFYVNCVCVGFSTWWNFNLLCIDFFEKCLFFKLLIVSVRFLFLIFFNLKWEETSKQEDSFLIIRSLNCQHLWHSFSPFLQKASLPSICSGFCNTYRGRMLQPNWVDYLWIQLVISDTSDFVSGLFVWILVKLQYGHISRY